MAARIRDLRGVLLLTLIVAVPLIQLPDRALDGYSLPKVSILAIGVLAAVALAAVEWMLSGRGMSVTGALIPAAALFLPVAASWAIASDVRWWALLGEYSRFQGLLPSALFAGFGLLVADTFRGRTRRVVIALASTGGAVAGYAIVQALGLDPVWIPGESQSAYPPSTIGHFNFAGGFIALGLPPAMWLWLSSRGTGRILWTAVTIVDVLAVILTFSQGAWAAAAAAAVLTAGYSVRARRARVAAWIGVAAIAVAVLGSVVLSGVFDLDAGATARSRAGFWSAAGEMASESPVVGHGPDAFALQGNSFRSLETAVRTTVGPTNDPHSIPLAYLTNAGLLGFVGFVIAAYWGIRRGMAAIERDPASIALLGVILAYLVQGLVSIDMPVLRLGFWAALGGVAGALPSPRARKETSTRIAVPFRAALSVVVIVASLALSFMSVHLLLRPDIRARTGVDLLSTGRYEAAIAALDTAVDHRADPEYRHRLLTALGASAIVEGPGGGRSINELVASAIFLDTFPDREGHLLTGHYLHAWAWFEPESEPDALRHFQQALRLYPGDIDARVLASESLIALGRPDEAVTLLAPVATDASGILPEYWGAYAVALLESGDREAAVAASREALESGGGCRALLAAELLRLTTGDDPGPPADPLLRTLTFSCDQDQQYFYARLVPERYRSLFLPIERA